MGCSECGKPVIARGWCVAHYKRWHKYGDPLAGLRFQRPRGLTEAEAFAWFMPGDPPEEGCWDWTASTFNGYGQFMMTVNGIRRPAKAHRVSYEIYHGPIPEGLDILHSCDRPVCVQPAHLRAGTPLENHADAVLRSRHAHGETSYAKLTEIEVLAIRESSRTRSELAQIYNVSQGHISNICNGKAWKHLL